MSASVVTKRLTHDQWLAEGAALFGFNRNEWKFKCPSCGHVVSVQDYVTAGAHENATAIDCIGRYTGSTKTIFDKTGGPCNYTGGGLIQLNPVALSFDGVTYSLRVFAFAEAA